MIASRPSRTAERVALRRAAHQLLDDPRVHEDPLALPILGEVQAAALRMNPHATENSRMDRFLRAFLAVRSRVVEDLLHRAVATGVRGYVVLRAGLDTFAYRNPHPGVRVLEVDHPVTQAWKRQRLAEARISVPEAVTFVPVDFAADSLAAALRMAGLRSEEPSFFSWLGVTPYLEPDAVLATLTAVAPFTANGGGIVFDYAVSPESLAAPARAAFEALAARVAAAGEPFRAFFEPQALVRAVRALGFHDVRDLAPEELNAEFFAKRKDGLRVGSADHLLAAMG